MNTRLVLSLILSIALTAAAAPAKHKFFQYTQPDGSTVMVKAVGDEFGHYYVDVNGMPMLADADGTLRPTSESEISLILQRGDSIRAERIQTRKLMRAQINDSGDTPTEDITPPQYGLGLFADGYPKTGEVHGLIFLVEFQDVRFTTPNVKDYYTRQLNEEGFSDDDGTGSARDYFLLQSSGIFQPTFDVYGPILLPNNMEYYGKNDFLGYDKNPEKMVTHAAEILADEIDFSQYDYDNDGIVDNIFVIYAGLGENGEGGASSVWPHAYWIFEEISYNGKLLYGYACTNEISGGRPDGVGTFCHEFSHVLGLSDLYSTTASLSCTPKSWDILDSGCYNNDSRTPPNYSAFERNALGWIKPTIVSEPTDAILNPLSSHNEAYIIPTSKNTEFWILENRQKEGWDKYLPGHGMLIWHIDYVRSTWENNAVNNNASHQYVDIEEASTERFGLSSSLASYTFPGAKGVTEFSATTTPSMVDWAGNAIDFPFTEITETEGIITFKIAGGSASVDRIHAAGEKFSLHGNRLAYNGAAGSIVKVYSITGNLVAILVADSTGHAEAQLSAGLYIVSSASGTQKIAIK